MRELRLHPGEILRGGFLARPAALELDRHVLNGLPVLVRLRANAIELVLQFVATSLEAAALLVELGKHL